MRYRITWEGSTEDLITLAKAHIKDFTASGGSDLINGSQAGQLIQQHLTLHNTLKSVTVKKEQIKENGSDID